MSKEVIVVGVGSMGSTVRALNITAEESLVLVESMEKAKEGVKEFSNSTMYISNPFTDEYTLFEPSVSKKKKRKFNNRKSYQRKRKTKKTHRR